MKRKATIKTNTALFSLRMSALLVSLSFVIFSCNSEKKENDKKAPDEKISAKNDSAGNADFLSGKGKYAVLKLNKADLLLLFSNNQAKKLLIEFTDSNHISAPSKSINAITYAANLKNDIIGNSVYLFPENITNPQLWDTTNHQILGNNELSRKEVKIALGNVNKIDATTAKDLYFYPVKLANKHIAYFVSKDLVVFTTYQGGIKILTYYPPNGEASNPSPPAKPCDNNPDCDQ